MNRRILTATLTITLAALIIFGVPFAWALGRIYRSQQLTRLQQAASAAAVAVPVEGLHGTDPIEPPPVRAGIQLTYYDSSGAFVAGTGSSVLDTYARRALAGRPSEGAAGARLVVAVPITANEATVGSVEASSPLAAVTSRSIRSWLAMFILGAGALGAAAVIALWQARRLSHPVDDLVGAAARLGEGDFALNAAPSGIAEIDRANLALQATSVRLRELIGRERAFTANASHQLRTPLTALRLMLDNALLTPGVDVHQAVRDGIAEVDRLEGTLEQLLDLARTGGLPRRFTPLSQVMTALERRWRPMLAQWGRRFHLQVDPAVAERPSPATLAQIFDILVDNATTHGRGTVEVRASVVTGGISIEVQDEGDGFAAIPEAVAGAGTGSEGHGTGSEGHGTGEAHGNGEAHVTGTGRGEGHGLGLGLARSLIEAEGGRLVLKRTGPHPIVAVMFLSEATSPPPREPGTAAPRGRPRRSFRRSPPAQVVICTKLDGFERFAV